jgi:N-acetyl-gamma-glutamyl-phosphate reductase
MSRGILTTATAKVAPDYAAKLGGGPGLAAELRQLWVRAYADEPFVNVLPEGRWPSTKSVQASNYAALQIAYDPNVNRVVACCAIDNLTKGTAGGAVQSMNIALGLAETTGLSFQGVAP